MATNKTTTAHLLRDLDPEAKALGGWYVEIREVTPRGELIHSTDYCRTKHGAAVAGLALAYRLGLPLEPLPKN